MVKDITKCLELENKTLPKGNFINGVRGFAEGLIDAFGLYSDGISKKTLTEDRGYILGQLAFFPALIVGGAVAIYLGRNSSPVY